MANLFVGYYPSKGKTPTVKIKGTEPLPTPPIDGDYVGMMREEFIQVDIDDKDLAEKVRYMLDKEKVKCDILKTSRGLHFYFKNTRVKSVGVHVFTACGIPCDIGVAVNGKIRCVPLRTTNEETGIQTTREWLQKCDEVDELPCWLFPISRKDFGFMETETRNSSLFTYIPVLQNKNMNKEEIREIINIINRYVLKTPLQQKEIDVITRDDAFSEELFFDADGKFLHNRFGDYMLTNSNIVIIDGQCNIYTDDGLYTNDPMEFERVMLEKIPCLKDNQRKEVFKYICLRCSRKGEFADPKYIGLKDTIIDLETMNEFSYTPHIIINNKINYRYNASAYSEVMDKTLDKVCCHDKQLRSLLEEMIGYTLYRSASMQTCFILSGEGSNGKSTILNCIKKLVGKDNYTSLDLRELEDTFKPAELYNKLANLGDDISSKYLDTSSKFKKCVTGESFIVQRKYMQPFELECYATQIFCANEMPQVADRSDGFGRRITIIPFNAKFSKHDADYDPFIESKLLAESSIEYLLKLAIDGLKRVLVNNHFTTSDKGEAEKKEYMKFNNNVLDWIENDSKIENEAVNDVYMSYQVWCAQNGCSSVKKLNFTKEIKKLGYDTRVTSINGKSVRIYYKREEDNE